MVAVGDSLLAGFGSGGLVGRGQTGQKHGTTRLIARQARVKMPQPFMSGPGVPPAQRIVDANGNGVLDAGEVRWRFGIGFRSAPDREARNLAVPGEDITSVSEGIDVLDVAEQIITGSPDGRDIMKFLILGLPLEDDSVSQLDAARERQPSFILFWLGNNDVLGMATRTNPNGADLTPEAFGTAFRQVLGELAQIGVGMAVANLPDVTEIAALRHPGGEVTGCRQGDGTIVPATDDWLLSIDLDPAELPQPACTEVLDSAEGAFVRTTVQAFNAEIAAAVAEREAAGSEIALVDMFAHFDELALNGYDARGDGTLILTTDYLGGIFSLDGIHPSRTGHALIANAFIEAINVRFGETIPLVNVARVANRDPLVGHRFRPTGEPPFGLIDEPEGTLDEAFSRVEDRVDDIADDLEDEIDDIFDDIGDVF
jgi:lysophospholipase L1-like esterase